jgi:hypothetical protein
MLFEHQQAKDSKWAPYFDVLPTEFDTPMFWSEDELKDLKGSAMANKIGKASADATFEEQILPLVYQNVQAFNAQNLSNDQLLALCHRMGSTWKQPVPLPRARRTAGKKTRTTELDPCSKEWSLSPTCSTPTRT